MGRRPFRKTVSRASPEGDKGVRSRSTLRRSTGPPALSSDAVMGSQRGRAASRLFGGSWGSSHTVAWPWTGFCGFARRSQAHGGDPIRATAPSRVRRGEARAFQPPAPLRVTKASKCFYSVRSQGTQQRLAVHTSAVSLACLSVIRLARERETTCSLQISVPLHRVAHEAPPLPSRGRT